MFAEWTLAHARFLVWWCMVFAWVVVPHLHAVGRRYLPALLRDAGGADLRKTGKITQKGLDYYISYEVPKLTQGLQTPMTVIPFGTPDFQIFEAPVR